MAPVASLLLLLLVVATVAVQVSGYDDNDGFGIVDKTKFFKNYAKMKIFESCFGKDITSAWHRAMDALLVKCYVESEQRRAGPGRRRRATLTQVTGAQNSNRPFYEDGKVHFIKIWMAGKLQFDTCTLGGLNLTINEKGQVDTAHMINYFGTLNIDADLKKDIISGVEKCAAETPCDYIKKFGPIDVDFQKKVKFVRCEQQSRIKSCMRKDFRINRNQFELQGLDGVLDELDDMDKMMFVATSYASLLGGKEIFI